jgi:hypothetical protein
MTDKPTVRLDLGPSIMWGFILGLLLPFVIMAVRTI